MAERRNGSTVDPARLAAACALAIEVHDGQVRKGTDIPYAAHVLAVTALVLEHGGSADQAVAAALHDVVEDGGVDQLERVRARFGDDVARMVADLSDAAAAPGQPKPPWRERKRAHHAHLSELVDRGDPAVLVAACDSLHNLRAIAADLDDPSVGSLVFSRFNADSPADTVWNHGERLRRYGDAPEDLVPPRLKADLEAAFARVQQGAEAAGTAGAS